MDLLHEVRQVSRQLQVAARRCTRGITYADALRDLIDDRMHGADRRARIICYASAAELGVHVELAAEHARQAMTGGLGFPMRVLFWAAYRRMQSGRHRRPGAWPRPDGEPEATSEDIHRWAPH
ncbi:hypothetical protein [Cupriavidus necator]|uniref:hypothetical protein n=1 Tax=Cupriavidus necator TaxID=106590 RepID=UPI000AC65D6F|nr:hypothetical protein [Cupriavidus necator]